MSAETYIVYNRDAMRRLMAYIDRLPYSEKTQYEVSIKRVRPKKTKQQRSFFHVIVRQIAVYTGHGEEEIKDMLKEKFLQKREIEIGGKVELATPSTEDLEVDEMSKFIDNVLDFAANDVGIIIERQKDLERVA